MFEFDNAVVAETIKELRERHGYNQEVLSGLAGISRSHLSMIENNVKKPNFETIWKLAIAFGLRPSELVALIENHNSK